MGRPTINGGVLQTIEGRWQNSRSRKEALQSQRHHALGSPPAAHWQWRAWASGAQRIFWENPVPRKKGVWWVPKIQFFFETKGCFVGPQVKETSFFRKISEFNPTMEDLRQPRKHQHSRSWWTKNHGKHQIFISLWMAKPWVSCHFSPWNQNINTPIEIPVPAIPIEMAVCPTTY